MSQKLAPTWPQQQLAVVEVYSGGTLRLCWAIWRVVMVKCGQLFVKWDFKKKQLSLRSGCEGVVGRVGVHVGESKHPFVLQEPIGGPNGWC